ncbi:MAG: radical SAM protein [Candidatus Wukongarchaeota archaeon]|nr:radical SAM protein [Candidatus Wukongarchaeota archaeon]MDO8128758.1 radical SAM protein [Candidatus Wukongarchaeota archaeon]
MTSLTVNLSHLFDLFPLEFLGDRVFVSYKRSVKGVLDLKKLYAFLCNRLESSDLSIDLWEEEGNLVFYFEASSKVDESELVKLLEEFASRSLGETAQNYFTGRKLIFLDRGFPLMGSDFIGIIDRGTNLIEVKPCTGCNLNCVFCSVDEGPYSKTRKVDYIAYPDRLIEVFKEVASHKGFHHLEAHIDAQGEPTIYPYLLDLIRGLNEIPGVEVISIQTNGTLLDKDFIKNLEKAGLTRINLSINSLDSKKAKKISGTKSYDIKHVVEIAELIINNSKIDLLTAPVWVPGINDEDIKETVLFTKALLEKKGETQKMPILGIQNCLRYRFGRNPKKVRFRKMESFYEHLEKLERELELKPLKLRKEDFGVHSRRSPLKPFRKGEVLEARVIGLGRLPKTVLALSGERLIQVINCTLPIGKKFSVKIVRTKHNIFTAIPA